MTKEESVEIPVKQSFARNESATDAHTWESLNPLMNAEGLRGPDGSEIINQMRTRSSCRVSKQDITELRTMSNPPQMVVDILNTLFYTLGYKTEEEQDEAMALFKGRKLNLIDRI